MISYDLMINVNYHLIRGGILSNEQKKRIVDQFLSDKRISDEQVQPHTNSKMLSTLEKNSRRMYPIFYIPPYNHGKKLKTILGQTPKTQILSANMYELEILRLLFVLAPDNVEVQNMVTATLTRLKTTCFGFMDDGVGECFDTSLIVLRFLATVRQDETAWIKSKIDNYNRHYGDKKRSWYSLWYYWLCLSELPFVIAHPEIDKYKNKMLDQLTNKSFGMSGENDKLIHPVLLCILRNILSQYPEFEYIRDRQPYIHDKDGRLYFDMMR